VASQLHERLRQLTSEHGGTNNNVALKRVADMRAEALRSTILEVRTAGFVSGKAIAGELNARALPTAAGSKWHPTTVTRLLKAQSSLEQQAPTLGPFFCPWNRFSPRLAGRVVGSRPHRLLLGDERLIEAIGQFLCAPRQIDDG
jgi:hypothetical protein